MFSGMLKALVMKLRFLSRKLKRDLGFVGFFFKVKTPTSYNFVFSGLLRGVVLVCNIPAVRFILC